MPIYLDDLLADPKLLERLRSSKEPLHCVLGNHPFNPRDDVEGAMPMKMGVACADCYYGKLGDLVEQHPIPSAGIRRS